MIQSVTIFSSVTNHGNTIFSTMLLAGAYPYHKMGDEDIHTPCVRSPCVRNRGTTPCNTFSVTAVNVGGWDYIWFWIWPSPHLPSYSYRCISSLLHQLSLLRQNPSMCLIMSSITTIESRFNKNKRHKLILRTHISFIVIFLTISYALVWLQDDITHNSTKIAS